MRSEHLVVELRREAGDRWRLEADGKGARVHFTSPADHLDELGRDGWQLVSVTPMHARSSLGGVQTDIVMYTLSRVIED